MIMCAGVCVCALVNRQEVRVGRVVKASGSVCVDEEMWLRDDMNVIMVCEREVCGIHRQI